MAGAPFAECGVAGRGLEEGAFCKDGNGKGERIRVEDGLLGFVGYWLAALSEY